jgi:hypothetical protein
MSLEPSKDAEPVRFRAFRGSRRTSVYREHVLVPATVRRLARSATSERLSLLAALDRGGAQELDRDGARRLAREVEALTSLPTLADLSDDLGAIAELARWCARSSRNAWLTIGAA